MYFYLKKNKISLGWATGGVQQNEEDSVPIKMMGWDDDREVKYLEVPIVGWDDDLEVKVKDELEEGIEEGGVFEGKETTTTKRDDIEEGKLREWDKD